MKAEFVNPFIESLYEMFKTMLEAEVKRTGLAVSNGQKQASELVAVIGFSGVIKGTAGVALPNATALSIASKLLGEEITTINESVSDTISELVNIIAGSAKSKISDNIGSILELSLPVVLRGDDFEVYSPSKALWLEIPFESDLGVLTLRLSFEATMKK